MAYDYKKALQSGASEDQVLDYLNRTRGYDVDGALKSGASKGQVIEYLSSTPRPVSQQKVGKQEITGNNSVKGFAKGVAQSGIGFARGTAQVLQDVGQRALAALTPGKTYADVRNETGFKSLKDDTPEGMSVKEWLTPQTGAEKFGKGLGDVAQFALPLTKVSKAERALDFMIEGSKLQNQLLKSGSKIIGKSLIEGGVGGAIGTGQSGSIQEGLESGAIIGGVKVGTGIVGEGLRGIKVPEALYQRIFKNNYGDMTDELRSVGIEGFAKKYPERFKLMQEQGVIKNVNGKLSFDKSLAEQALNRGLKGSIKNMTNAVVQDTLELESTLQGIARSSPKTIKVNNAKNLINVLKETSQRYENVGGGEIARKAMSYAEKLEKGKINISDTLGLRRFLDGMRFKSSFDTNAPLSQGQQNFKYWSDLLRGRLAEVEGFQRIMKNYSFNIDALEALAKEETRRGNNQIVGLIDAALFGGGLVASSPTTGALAGLTRRALNSSVGLTNTAQAIKNSNITKKGAFVKGAIGAATNDRSAPKPR